MIVHDHKDAMLCDFAQYYGIYQIDVFPARYIATLAVGLPLDSRVKGVFAGLEDQPPVGVSVLKVFDAVQNLAYAIAGGKEAPTSAINAYIRHENATDGYSSGAEFERARNAILEKKKRRNNG